MHLFSVFVQKNRLPCRFKPGETGLPVKLISISGAHTGKKIGGFGQTGEMESGRFRFSDTAKETFPAEVLIFSRHQDQVQQDSFFVVVLSTGVLHFKPESKKSFPAFQKNQLPILYSTGSDTRIPHPFRAGA